MTALQARCSCGQLTLEVMGDPVRVSVCHCLACQRRTGSAFGVQARFARDEVRIAGCSNQYTRAGDSGQAITFHFCPRLRHDRALAPCQSSGLYNCGGRRFRRSDIFGPEILGIRVEALSMGQYPRAGAARELTFVDVLFATGRWRALRRLPPEGFEAMAA
jgi:hypothetical protein